MSTPQGSSADLDEDEQPTVTNGVTREHLIVLCCAHSVVELVEEVARNLRGLGFAVEVVCGAEARTALLGRGTGGDEPTIYVVCVQGTLKEQVLKPLRQALATHGGPNQHLFVAVLDLSLPLAMVGQIRRFSEALERPRRGRGSEGVDERRQWREQLGPNTERVATRSYRALEVVNRSDTAPPVGIDSIRRTGPQALIGGGRPAKIGATAKYRAVTGSLPVGEPSSEGNAERRRRRARAPKVRVKPVARPHAAAAAAVVVPSSTDDTVVTSAPTVVVRRATPSVPLVAESEPALSIAQPPELGSDAPTPARGRWPLALVGVGVLGAAAAALWITGAAQRIVGTGNDAKPIAVAQTPTAIAAPERAPEAKPAEVIAPQPIAPPVASPTPAVAAVVDPPVPAPVAAPVAEVPAEAPPAAAPPAEAQPAEAPPAEAPPAEAPPPAAAPPAGAGALEPAFAAAIEARRMRVTDSLYVSLQPIAQGSWQAARNACDALEIGGVGGFRLPHRRELQGLDSAHWLRDAPHWSRTVPDDDSESAYVLHPSTGQLTVWFKEEVATAVCVRSR